MTDPAVRVLVLAHPAGARGGIAAFTDHLADHLGRRTDVDVVRYHRLYPPATAPGRAERAGVERPGPGPTAYLPWTWWRALSPLVRLRPSLLVVQWWHPLTAPLLLAMALVARATGVRVGVVCHNALPHERFPLARPLTRLLLRRADVVWTLSEHVADEVARIAPAVAVEVVGHPANVTGTALPAPRPAGPDQPRHLLFFGHVRPYKGLDDLLLALTRTATTPAPTLTVAGPFYTAVDEVRRTVSALGLDDRVRLLDGYVDDADVPAMFAAADLVVLPYRGGSQSGVLSLAAEFARPVVVTDVGSLAADIAGRGVVVPAADPAALAAGIDRALASPPAAPPRHGSWSAWADAVLTGAGRPPAGTVPPSHRRRIVAWTAWAVVLAFTAAVFARTLGHADEAVWPGVGAIALAALALTLTRTLHVAQWHLLLRGYSASLRPLTSARILTSSELARFVPGGVWHLAAAYRLSTRAGVPAPSIVATACTDVALRLASAFALFFVGLWAWPRLSGAGVVGGALGLGVALLALHPAVVRGLAHRLTRRRADAGVPVVLSRRHLVVAVLLSLLLAVARGLAAVAILAGAGRHVDVRTAVVVVGAVALAWALGVLVPFAPGGLGVQEASGAALLSVVTPAAVAAATFVALRVVQIAVELATTAACVAADRAVPHHDAERIDTERSDAVIHLDPAPAAAPPVEAGSR